MVILFLDYSQIPDDICISRESIIKIMDNYKGQLTKMVSIPDDLMLNSKNELVYFTIINCKKKNKIKIKYSIYLSESEDVIGEFDINYVLC